MKKSVYLAWSGLLIIILIAACTNQLPTPGATEQELTMDSSVRRGQYLVTAIGCSDCHTPKKMTPDGPIPDMDKFLAGYDASKPLGQFDTSLSRAGRWMLFNTELTAAAGPMGISFAANLTPDETGIGGWTLDNFKRALRKGKYKGLENSRPLLPTMPWKNFANLSDNDIEAIFNYLKTIKPVSNLVPQAIIAKR